jgi:AAA ATPase-like protein/transcriptional activator
VLASQVEALLRAGEAAEAVRAAQRALALDPRSERAARAAIRAHALAGDRAAALEAYERLERRLAELGTVPEPETVELASRAGRQRLTRPARAAGQAGAAGAGTRLPLAGRATELQRLLDAVAASQAARRASVLAVEGEMGAGKTRLAEELLARLRLDGAAVSAARAVEGDRGDAGAGLAALARGGLLDAGGIAGASPGALAALARAAPEWAERFPGATAVPPLPLARALTEVARAAVDEQPVVFAVDDAQWLDDASTTGLVALLRDLTSAPVTLLLAISPYHPRPDLDELRSRIGRDLAGAVVRLGPLSAAAIRELAARMLPSYDPIALDRVVRRVATDSAGVPLIAVELLRAVALGLDLGAIASAWPEPQNTLDQSLPGDLPDAVVAAIRVAGRRLTPLAQRVLAAVSILGDRVPPERVARTLRLPVAEIHPALDELEWHHWLVAEPRGYGFVARIVRRIVERDFLTPGQKRRLLEAAGGDLTPA